MLFPVLSAGKHRDGKTGLGTVTHSCNPSYSGGGRGRIMVKASCGLKCDTYLKNKKKRAGCKAQLHPLPPPKNK
jgi:hypothetical protein